MRRYSGMDKDMPKAKWIDFRIIHSVASKPEGMSFLEKADLDHLVLNSVRALDEIKYLQEDFEIEIHHSVGKIQNLSLCSISKFSPPNDEFCIEI